MRRKADYNSQVQHHISQIKHTHNKSPYSQINNISISEKKMSCLTTRESLDLNKDMEYKESLWNL